MQYTHLYRNLLSARRREEKKRRRDSRRLDARLIFLAFSPSSSSAAVAAAESLSTRLIRTAGRRDPPRGGERLHNRANRQPASLTRAGKDRRPAEEAHHAGCRPSRGTPCRAVRRARRRYTCLYRDDKRERASARSRPRPPRAARAG